MHGNRRGTHSGHTPRHAVRARAPSTQSGQALEACTPGTHSRHAIRSPSALRLRNSKAWMLTKLPPTGAPCNEKQRWQVPGGGKTGPQVCAPSVPRLRASSACQECDHRALRRCAYRGRNGPCLRYPRMCVVLHGQMLHCGMLNRAPCLSYNRIVNFIWLWAQAQTDDPDPSYRRPSPQRLV